MTDDDIVHDVLRRAAERAAEEARVPLTAVHVWFSESTLTGASGGYAIKEMA